MSAEFKKMDPQAPKDQSMTEHPDIVPDAPANKFDACGLCCPTCLACTMSIIFPCQWLGGCISVREKSEDVLLHYGKYTATVSEPGCYCVNPAGRQVFTISTGRIALPLSDVKVADARGNPLVLSSVVTYQVVSAKKAALDVQSLGSYIQNQGLSVMKKVAAMYPYESQDGHSLKTEAEKIRRQMIQLLQERCDVAGVLVCNFELVDLAYAPEIAQAMLIRQQAEAMVDARKIIVKGAVEIAAGAIESLAAKGLRLEPAEQARLTSNLLITICGDTKVQPVISLSADQGK